LLTPRVTRVVVNPESGMVEVVDGKRGVAADDPQFTHLSLDATSPRNSDNRGDAVRVSSGTGWILQLEDGVVFDAGLV
jgi:hypothetical protein